MGEGLTDNGNKCNCICACFFSTYIHTSMYICAIRILRGPLAAIEPSTISANSIKLHCSLHTASTVRTSCGPCNRSSTIRLQQTRRCSNSIMLFDDRAHSLTCRTTTTPTTRFRRNQSSWFESNRSNSEPHSPGLRYGKRVKWFSVDIGESQGKQPVDCPACFDLLRILTLSQQRHRHNLIHHL